MRRMAVILITLPLALSLIVTGLLQARKKVVMPDNFGTSEWAATNYKDAVGCLKYLADNDVRQELFSAPEHKKFEAWEEFWKERDPLSSTSENEFRDQYFARIRYANENFGTILQPGWLTDRGEVWIRLGEPNYIEKFTMRASGNDLEVWNYWVPRDVYLVFLDRTGVGDFYLLNTSEMLDEVYFR